MQNKSISKKSKPEHDQNFIAGTLMIVPIAVQTFKEALENATAETIQKVMEGLPEENNKSRIRVLKAQLNKLEKSRPAENLDGDEKTVSNLDVVRSIPIDKIIPSPFEPQTRRRTKFLENEIAALAASIGQFGLRQPILVRPRFDEFEIVFGERRFLACGKAGFENINCFVESLSDAEVVELQYEENHNRLEPDPLDDAFTFHYLQTEKGYTVEDLSIKFAMDKSSVRRRLKLNDLIDEAKELLSSGKMPLGHAVFMAALPETAQKEIIDEHILTDGWEDDPVIPLADFKIEVEREIVRDLSNAPFDVSDPRLHIKNLICPNCTQRTGYEPALFDDELSRGDKCLNKQCFEIKTNTNLRIKHQEIAEKRTMPVITDDSAGIGGGGTDENPEQKISSVPLVTERSHVDKNELPVKGKVLTNQNLMDEPECEFSERALAVAGAKKGQEVWTCQNDKCPVHHPETIAPEDQKSGPTDAELKQKENLYQIKVAIAVRERVFAKSIEHFTGSNSFWQYADLVEKLLVELVSNRYGYLIYIDSIFKGWKNFPKTNTPENVEKFVAGLDARRRDQLLFLCVFAGEGFMLPVAVGEYKSQTEIEKLAKSYARIDYGDLDADVRVELAPDEFKAIAEEYRDDYRNDEPVVVPRFWWEGFEFPD